MIDIVVVKGDPSTEELAALTVALWSLGTAARTADAPRQASGHRCPPAPAHVRVVMTACECA